MPTWPSTLPQELEATGFQQQARDRLIRSSLPGVQKIRRRNERGTTGVLQGEMLLSRPQWDTLLTFYRTTLADGALEFDFPDPDFPEQNTEQEETPVYRQNILFSWLENIEPFYPTTESITYEPDQGNRIEITTPQLIPPSSTRFLARLRMWGRNITSEPYGDGTVEMRFVDAQNDDVDENTIDNLSDDFEAEGRFTFEIDGHAVTVEMDGSAGDDPYLFQPDNNEEVADWVATVDRITTNQGGNGSIMFELDGETPPPPELEQLRVAFTKPPRLQATGSDWLRVTLDLEEQ